MESIEIKRLLAFSSECGEARLQPGQLLFDHLHIMSKFIVVNILLVSLKSQSYQYVTKFSMYGIKFILLM